MDDNQEFEVLLLQLRQRYEEAARMRERSQRFVIWLSGMAFALASVILLGPLALGETNLRFLVAVIVWIGLLAVLYLATMARGFSKNHVIIQKLETVAELHTPGAYGQKEALLLSEYSTPPRWFSLRNLLRHFTILTIWVIVLFVLLIALVIDAPRGSVHQQQTQASLSVQLIALKEDGSNGTHQRVTSPFRTINQTG